MIMLLQTRSLCRWVCEQAGLRLWSGARQGSPPASQASPHPHRTRDTGQGLLAVGARLPRNTVRSAQGHFVFWLGIFARRGWVVACRGRMRSMLCDLALKRLVVRT